jgi:hypothetical protein
MCDMANKFKALGMTISDGFLVHFIMTSLLPQYSPFKISYKTQKETWNIAELTIYCVEEEERQKMKRGRMWLTLLGLTILPKIKLNQEATSSLRRNLIKIR